MTGDLGTFQQGVETLTALTVEDEVLQGLAVLLKKSVRARWTAVYFRNRDRTGFDPVRSAGLPPRRLGLFQELPLPPDKIPLLKKLLRKRKHLSISDSQGFDLLPSWARQVLKGVTLLAVPMLVRGQVEGVVFLARKASEPTFSQNEIELIRLTTSHAALVASHISLFNESLEMSVTVARRSDVIFTLDEINKSISSTLSHDKIIETAVERIGWIIRCNLIAVLVQERGNLVVQVARGNGFRVPRSLTPGSSLPAGNLAQRAFESAAKFQICSLSQEKLQGKPDRALREAGLESLLAIPLVSKESSKGVLLLGLSDPGGFSEEDTFALDKIAAQMAVALENARLYEEMRELFISTVASLTNAIDAKSPWTMGHSERVMHLSVALAGELDLDEATTERIRLGSLLHDIGKIGVIDRLLDIHTPLSTSEIVPMRLHPEMGVAILAPIEKLRDVLPGILHHHEWFDGSGYPKGLKGDEIPLEARVIAVADAFDAIESNRPYRKSSPSSDPLNELRRNEGTQFDPRVVQALVRLKAPEPKQRVARS